MKKIHLLTKIIFHIFNIGLILLYLYPGSILGWLIYKDFKKQPQITTDFIVSSNHFYVFVILTMLGLISYINKKIKVLFLYLFFISTILELCHIVIPERTFQYSDLFGNLLGVFLIFMLFHLYKISKENK